MRPSRTRRAPIAADGTLLVATKQQQSREKSSPSAKPSKRARDVQSPTDADEGTSNSQRAEQSAAKSAAQPSSPSKKKQKRTLAHAEELNGGDDDDIEIDITERAEPTTSKSSSKRKRPERNIDSPIASLPDALRADHLSEAKNRVLDVLTGNLPPRGLNEAGQADGSECIGLDEQWRSLYSALSNTLQGEGNSALLVGAPGTGKSLLLDSVLRKLEDEKNKEDPSKKRPFHLVHLDAALQATDRLSLRELARQLVKLGAIRQPKPGEEDALGLGAEEEAHPEDEEEYDPFAEHSKEQEEGGEVAAALQSAVFSSLANTTSTILTLLSSEQASSRSSLPLIIVLSSFDLFTSRPRQALLYVLLDAVQAGSYTPGLCVVGQTSRLDTTDLLEKRVRSRFSGRTINTWSSVPWIDVLKRVLSYGLTADLSEKESTTFNEAWTKESEQICKDKEIVESLSNWESMGNDIRNFYHYLFPIFASVSASQPPSVHAAFLHAIDKMSARQRSVLDQLSTPEFALLIAAKQLLSRDREVFNFAMCFNEVRQFVKRVERDRIGAGTIAVDISRRASALDDDDNDEDAQVFQSPRKQATASNVSVAWHSLLNRHSVLKAFRTLLSLELFQPEIVVNSLTHTGAASSTAASAAARRAAQTAKTDFMRVKCTLFPQTIVEAAKSKRRVEQLSVHMVQWAVGHS